MPPCLAIAMAISASVTVSMLALTMGVRRQILRVRGARGVDVLPRFDARIPGKQEHIVVGQGLTNRRFGHGAGLLNSERSAPVRGAWREGRAFGCLEELCARNAIARDRSLYRCRLFGSRGPSHRRVRARCRSSSERSLSAHTFHRLQLLPLVNEASRSEEWSFKVTVAYADVLPEI